MFFHGWSQLLLLDVFDAPRVALHILWRMYANGGIGCAELAKLPRPAHAPDLRPCRPGTSNSFILICLFCHQLETRMTADAVIHQRRHLFQNMIPVTQLFGIQRQLIEFTMGFKTQFFEPHRKLADQ